jgi:hypothetical protein
MMAEIDCRVAAPASLCICRPETPIARATIWILLDLARSCRRSLCTDSTRPRNLQNVAVVLDLYRGVAIRCKSIIHLRQRRSDCMVWAGLRETHSGIKFTACYHVRRPPALYESHRLPARSYVPIGSNDRFCVKDAADRACSKKSDEPSEVVRRCTIVNSNSNTWVSYRSYRGRHQLFLLLSGPGWPSSHNLSARTHPSPLDTTISSLTIHA